MQSKRGQITLFIIIGILIVVIVGIIFYVKFLPAKEEAETIPMDVAAVKLFVDECLERASEDAMLSVAFYGGYYNIPENSTEFNDLGVPYYYIKGQILVPSKTKIQNELAAYVNDNLIICLSDFEPLKERGYGIETGDPSITVEIAEKKVFFTLNYPLVIRKDETENTLNEFNSEIKANLLKMRDAAAEYINAQKEVPEATRLGHLIDISNKYDLFSNVFRLGNDVLYSFTDQNSDIRGEQLTFTFSVHYAPKVLVPSTTVIINKISKQTATVGEEFYLKLSAVGKNLKYHTTTNLFNVSDKGEIRFIPTDKQIGSYSILITAEDDAGNLDYAVLELTIGEASEGIGE